MFKSVTSVGDIKGLWKVAKAWHNERSGEVVGKCTASVAAECPKLKGHERKLKFGSMERACRRILVKMQPSCCRRPQDFTVSWDDYNEEHQ